MAEQSPRPVTLEQVAEKLSALCDKADALFRRYYRATNGPQLFTVEEAAAMLSLSERAVETLLKRGQLAYVDVCVKPNSSKPRKRIAECDLAVFIESRRVVPPPSLVPIRRRRRRRALGLLP